MTDKDYRLEKDSMGELKVPGEKHWGAQTRQDAMSPLIIPRNEI